MQFGLLTPSTFSRVLLSTKAGNARFWETSFFASPLDMPIRCSASSLLSCWVDAWVMRSTALAVSFPNISTRVALTCRYIGSFSIQMFAVFLLHLRNFALSFGDMSFIGPNTVPRGPASLWRASPINELLLFSVSFDGSWCSKPQSSQTCCPRSSTINSPGHSSHFIIHHQPSFMNLTSIYTFGRKL